MITITDEANGHLRTLISEHIANEKGSTTDSTKLGLRLFVERGGCAGMQYAMKVDSRKPDDLEFGESDAHVFIDPESSQFLKGITLDYHDGLTGAGFQIKNPAASRTCGCGTSFEPPK